VKGRPSPAVAAALSFLLPGLGQMAIGAVRRGLLLLIPLVVIGILVVAISGGGISELVDLALSSEVLVAFLVVNILLTAWHVYAIVDAERGAIALEPAPRAPHRGATAALIALVIATIALHGAVEVVGYQAYATLEEVFVSSDGDDGFAIPEPSFDDEGEGAATATPVPTPTPTAGPTATPVPTPTPTPTPSPTPGPKWAKDGRLNLLLIGSDRGPGRWSLRTDTMIVLSVDQKTGRAAMFGIPRNMTDVPLAPESKRATPNGRFPGLLNALYVYAGGHPRYFPGGDARGFRAVTGAIQELVGVKLDGAVVVDLNGFVKLVNAIGGLWIDVPKRLVDNRYPLENGSHTVRIVIKAGCQKLNGHKALAYARSRHQDSDYGRMKRQQAVLLALAHQSDPIGLLPKVPELLKIAGDHLWTTLPRKDIAGLATLAARIDPSEVETITFTPPKYPSHMTTSWIRKIRKVVRTAFDGPAPKPKPSPSATESIESCRG
jgi:LCP family protein required for cell wall assembly